MRLLKLKRHLNQIDRKDANVSNSPLEKSLLRNYDDICDSVNLRHRNSMRRSMRSLNKCSSRLRKLQARNAKFKHLRLKKKEGAESSDKLCILEEILNGELACAELLFVLTHYIKDMEARLKNNRKLVQKLILQNQTLQKDVLAMHEDWLSSVKECEELEIQYRAWLFASTSEDANFSIFNSLNDQSCLDAAYKKIWQEDSTKLSTLPWILLPESKVDFQRLVDERWQAKDYHTSVHIAVDALNWSRVYPPSKQHRFPPQSIIELLRAVNYFAHLAVRCFNINNQTLSVFCANYAVKLLTNLRIDKKFQPADKTMNWPKRVQVFPKLSCASAHETDWAILLDAVRRLVSVYWRIGQFSEAVGLLKSILNIRSTIIWESWTGCTQLGCLLTAGLYLFAGQVSLQTLYPGEKVNLITLGLFELCVTWSEGALSAALVESSIRHQKGKSVDSTMELQLDAAFLLWALMLEVLCRYCANLGATNDVLLLGCRLMNILSLIKPWGEVNGVQLSQLLHVALLAEKNGVNRNLPEDSLQNSGGHVLDNYLRQFKCIETPESVESIFHEAVLVCRGQRWNTAAALIEWWITGCRLLRHGLAARRRRIRQTQMPQLTFDKLDQLKRRAVVINFLKFLAEISTGNGSVDNAGTSRLSSTLWIGKHRDCEPADVRCDFSQTSTDPRMRVFGLAYKNQLPIFMEELEKLYLLNKTVDNSVGLSENSFLLQSNRKLFIWWKQSEAEGRLTEIQVRYPLELMLNKKEIIDLWEDVRCLSYLECNSVLPLSKHKQQLITGQRPQVRSTLKKMHLIPDLNPFPVAESLTAVMHVNCGLDNHFEHSDDTLKSNNLKLMAESIHLEVPVKEATSRSKGCNKVMERKIGCWDSFRKKDRPCTSSD